MQLPQRPQSHITETSSYKIFENVIPDEWLCREVTEKDYGIDAYVEIAENECITGKLLSVQLKGTDTIALQKNGTVATYYGINASTMNYWNELPVPVVLLFIDVSSKEIYYCDVKKYIRNNYCAFIQEKLTSISIPVSQLLTKENTSSVFNQIYKEESSRSEFEVILESFVRSFYDNVELMTDHVCRDSFLGLDDSEESDMPVIRFVSLYNSLSYLISAFSLEWNVKSLAQIIKDSQERFGDYYSFYEGTLSETFEVLVPYFVKIFFGIKKTVLVDEIAYWRKKNITLVYFLLNDQCDDKIRDLISCYPSTSKQ